MQLLFLPVAHLPQDLRRNKQPAFFVDYFCLLEQDSCSFDEYHVLLVGFKILFKASRSGLATTFCRMQY